MFAGPRWPWFLLSLPSRPFCFGPLLPSATPGRRSRQVPSFLTPGLDGRPRPPLPCTFFKRAKVEGLAIEAEARAQGGPRWPARPSRAKEQNQRRSRTCTLLMRVASLARKAKTKAIEAQQGGLASLAPLF
jgi:hypothetical protein